METDVALANEQSKFRDSLRSRLKENEELFWQNMALLKPKEYVDAITKLLPYAYARVPDIRIDENGQQALILEETKRRAAIIGQGLPAE